MTVAETFYQGLLITGLGMALIFLTLLVIMALIFSLDRLFKPSEKEKREEASSVTAVEEMAPDLSAGQAPAVDLATEAAAIAVAIALQEARQTGTQDEDELYAETIMVNDIALDSGAWRGQGRLTAMQ